MERLIRDFVGSQAISQNFLDFEVVAIRENLSSFTTLVPKFRSTLRVRFFDLDFCCMVTDVSELGRHRAIIQPTHATKIEDADR